MKSVVKMIDFDTSGHEFAMLSQAKRSIVEMLAIHCVLTSYKGYKEALSCVK